ncbi:MAG: hypothetical protein IT348_15145, partial [Candidatus Eisenbacteria bacterium]|nr:hypothetical protein [Candidatus Eisenbacteria bacterium]
LLFLPLAAWFDAARRALDAAGGERTAGLSEGALVGATLALVMAGTLVECAFHRALWSARGARVAFAPLLLAVWLLSALEPLAGAAMEWCPPGSAGSLGLAPWVGARALAAPGGQPDAWAVAFGGAGLLAAARIALSAAAQARLAGRAWREALLQVLLVWLASHVALAWTLALVRGR